MKLSFPTIPLSVVLFWRDIFYREALARISHEGGGKG